MKERPILFSGPMVNAILDGRKTQTRRVAKIPLDFDPAKKPQSYGPDDFCFFNLGDPINTYPTLFNCPYGRPGDCLWVRETLKADERGMFYAADEACVEQSLIPDNYPIVKETLPSMFMPRRFSRITLEVTGVKVERLNHISEADMLAEGITQGDGVWNGSLRRAYMTLWNKINGKKYPWDSNPWVWVIEFQRIIA